MKRRTRYPGVRYEEHSTRTYGRKPDRYYTIRYTLDGRQREEGLGWSSEGWDDEKAAGVLAELKAAKRLGQGAYSLAEKRERVRSERREKARAGETIEQVGERYLESGISDLTPKNQATERRICRAYIFEHVGDHPARSFSEVDLKRFQATISKLQPHQGSRVTAGRTLAPRTVEHILIVLGKILKFAGVKSPPRVKGKKYDNRNQRYLSRAEADTLLAALKKEGGQVHDMALLSLGTGMRQGEVLALLVAHCDFASGAISIVDSKNKGRNRTVFMSRGARSVLLKNCEGKGKDQPVFCSERRGRHRALPTVYYKVVKGLGFNDGITDRRFRVDFHTLRHTYASWLIMSGKVSLYQLQKLLGHESITTTERYAHLAPANLKEAATVMDEISVGG